MSFEYDRVSHKGSDHGSWWTSYADLFMMLSIVFLLMYVASSLRNGSAGYKQQQDYQKLTKRAEDLEQQIKAYNTLKDESLKQETSETEQQVYQKLMDHLSLLQDDAKNEKETLQKKAKENEEKEFALNRYQQLVRNIINANVLAKSQIAHRNEIITTQGQTIEEKKAIIAHNEQQIESIHESLAENIRKLKNEQKHAKISKAVFEKRMAHLKQASEAQVRELTAVSEQVSQQLSTVKTELNTTQNKLGQAHAQLGQAHEQLNQAQAEINETQAALEKKNQEKAALARKLENTKGQYLAEMSALKAEHDAKLASERAAFDASLKKQRLSEAARAKKQAQFAEEAKNQAAELEGKLNGLRGKVAQTERELAGTQAEKQRALAAVENLQGQVGGLKGDLARSQAIANARKKLAAQIGDSLSKAGIKGVVDGKTGEVTLDFGEEYFDTGSTVLKPKMKTTLDKFIPLYARSLFNDPKVADNIANVEVVGFASSTYKGKYVNPKSSKASDKEAIEYNLKLSFGRATSIFDHMLNQGDVTQETREKLMPMMKVVGRGYLPEGVSVPSTLDGMSEKQFCAKYNCKRAQKVVIKFNMKD